MSTLFINVFIHSLFTQHLVRLQHIRVFVDIRCQKQHKYLKEHPTWKALFCPLVLDNVLLIAIKAKSENKKVVLSSRCIALGSVSVRSETETAH